MSTRHAALTRILFSVLALMVVRVGLADVSDTQLQAIEKSIAFGNVAPTAGTPEVQSRVTEEAAKRYHEFSMEQQHDKVIFAILLSITALIAQFVVLRSFPATDKSAMHVVSATGLIYIVFGTTILVVIASTEAQLTASMGILGAVAGYLFGRIRRDDGQEAEHKSSAHS